MLGRTQPSVHVVPKTRVGYGGEHALESLPADRSPPFPPSFSATLLARNCETGPRWIRQRESTADRPGGASTTQGPSWGYSKVNFDRFFRKRGRFSPNIDKHEPMAPRTSR